VGFVGEQRVDLRALPVGEQVRAGGQGALGRVERVAGVAAPADGLQLHPSAALFQALAGQPDGMNVPCLNSILTSVRPLT